jgi:cobalt-zinc-cadmium efflux system outer membrane protein
MYFKNTLAGLSLLAVCCSAQAQPPDGQVWTEQAVLSLFEQQSPIKRETRASAAAAVESLRARTLWPNPVTSYSRETVGFTEFVTAEQLLPVSGRRDLARKAMDPARESVEADGAARVWEIRSSLRTAYNRALAAQIQEDLIASSLAEVETIIQLLRTREQEGEGSRYDRMRVERETADLRADIAVAQSRARSERTFLLSYLPPDTPLSRLSGALDSRSISPALPELVQQALSNRAEFRAQSARLTQLNLEQQAAQRLRIPEPVVTGGLKRTQVGPGLNNTGAVIGVSVTLPLFNKGQTEVVRLGAEQERIQAQRDLLTQNVKAVLSGAYEVYTTRRAALDAFHIATGDSGNELLRVARIGYEEGELGILQLLDAYRLKRQTALRRLELELAVKESEIEVSRAAGMEVTQ